MVRALAAERATLNEARAEIERYRRHFSISLRRVCAGGVAVRSYLIVVSALASGFWSRVQVQ